MRFEGAEVFAESDLAGRISNQKSLFSWVPLLNLGLLNKRELDNDMVRLREVYWEKGYLDFKVKEIQMNPREGDPEKMDLVFVVEEVDPYTV